MLQLIDEDPDWVSINSLFDTHSSVSASGARIANHRVVGIVPPISGVQFEVVVHDFSGATPTPIVLTDPLGPAGDGFDFNDLCGPGPRVSISGDGKFAYYLTHDAQCLQNMLCAHDIDADTRACIAEPHTLARTQSPVTDDGSSVVTSRLSNGIQLASIARVSSGGAVVDLVPPVSPTGVVLEDATQSGDGSRVAWVSNWNHCTGTALPDMDLWLWIDDDPGGASTCTTPTGAHLVRLVTGNSGNESRPVMTRNGNRLFFISEANFGGLNPTSEPLLWYVGIDGGLVGPHLVTTAFELAEDIIMASPNADGSVVAYEVWTSQAPFRSDLRLIHVDEPGWSNAGAPLGPAHLPLEVDTGSCTLSGGVVTITGHVRSYNTGTKTVLLRYGVTSADGLTRDFAGPFVQSLVSSTNPFAANYYVVSGSVTTAITDGTCSITAIDGSAVQPDVVEGRRSFP